ncbi:hypothetical protein AAVH_42945, partial [Aphelenchoides avenae]
MAECPSDCARLGRLERLYDIVCIFMAMLFMHRAAKIRFVTIQQVRHELVVIKQLRFNTDDYDMADTFAK